jgi:hypothetical protein
MAGYRLIRGRTTFNLDTALEVLATPYQGFASSTVEGATLRRSAFHVNGSKRAEWRALASVRKRWKSLGYEGDVVFFNKYSRRSQSGSIPARGTNQAVQARSKASAIVRAVPGNP